jgi:FkbM family methyltransferase
VLASSGSFVEVMRERIRQRLPVLVTDPEATRFFMAVAEAASLVMKASLIAEGGETFWLDMGPQIRIGDLVDRLMRAGLEPGVPPVPVHVIWGAAWITDGEIDLFMSDRHEASTVMPGKATYEQYGWPPIDYTKPIRVPCFDFASWLAGLAEGAADVVVKMDIEGAEYPVLDRMMETGAINGVTDLFCEWHYDR